MRTSKENKLYSNAEKDELKTIGSRISHLRVQKKLSINELANLIHISPDYLGRLEKGSKDNPSSQVLCLLAQALDSSMDYIWMGKLEMNYDSSLKNCSAKNKIFLSELNKFVISKLEL